MSWSHYRTVATGFLGITSDRLRGGNAAQAPTAPTTLRHHRGGKRTNNP